jgi:acetyl esterase/lipase
MTSPAIKATLFAAVMLLSGVQTHCAADDDINDDVVVRNNLPYRDPSSKSCLLDLAMPREKAEKPRAAIVVIHGGGWIEGDKSSFSVREKRMPGNIIDFARRGFVAVTIN